MKTPVFALATRRFSALLVSLPLLFPAFAALAQTCANPIPLVDGQTHAYDSCIAPNSLPWFGGVYDSPQNDVVYRIHTNGTPSGSFHFNVNGSPWDLFGVIVNQCNPNAAVLGEYEANYNGPDFPLPALPAGDNFLIVTGNPYSAPATCGAYQVTAHISEPSPPGSCGAPITYTSGTHVQGNTCTATNTLNTIDGGAIASAQNDLAYRIDPSSIVDGKITINSADFNATAFLLSSCSASGSASSAIEIAAGTSGVLTVPGNLTGNQYLVVTGDPGGAPTGCGHFDFTDVGAGIVTDAAAFVAALNPGYYLEPFSQAPRGATEQRINFSKNGYAYSVTPSGSNAKLRYVMDTHGAPQSLSVIASSSARSLRISFAGLPVNAIGGMFAFNAGLLQQQGTITVSLRSGTKIKSYTLRGGAGFKGFGSRNRIDEVLISSSSSMSGALMIDNLIVGSAD